MVQPLHTLLASQGILCTNVQEQSPGSGSVHHFTLCLSSIKEQIFCCIHGFYDIVVKTLLCFVMSGA